MIKIAVCDDSPYELDQVNAQVQRYIERWPSVDKPELFSFSKANNLLAEIDSGRTMDVFILDVDMPDMDGFQLVEEIQKYIPAPIIIFLTSHIEYAPKAFKFRAFRYIVKLNLDEELFEALDSAAFEVQKIEERSITITHYNECYRVPYSDIMYVQLDNRQLNVCANTAGVIHDNRTIKSFFEALNDDRFVIIERGCIVNINFIKRIIDMEAILTNNERLTISRRMLQNLKRTLTTTWNL